MSYEASLGVSVTRGPHADRRVGSGGSKETPVPTLQLAQGEGGCVKPEGPQRPPCPGQTHLAWGSVRTLSRAPVSPPNRIESHALQTRAVEVLLRVAPLGSLRVEHKQCFFARLAIGGGAAGWRP